MRGDWAQAREHGLLAVDTARAAGSVIHEYVGLVYLGLPEARLGDVEGGASSLRRAIAIAQAAGTWVLLGRAHGWLAEVELTRGDAETAIAFARKALALESSPVDRGYALTALADALALEKKTDEADAAYREAVDILEGEARWHAAANACRAWGNLLRGAGKEEALDVLDRAAELGTRAAPQHTVER